ncbi:hypothetical protein [Tianweitania sediminis]|uniref:Uncharacterized protein n=1 Tax=Tianweitania sediminis TaxID=1502156 RepID=A0A8J7UH29_9HYPH|nr:hypothetical protein [Tianweitania sediminis]MBP0438769.1 hypothetical protein [Tianweitania sediminis]
MLARTDRYDCVECGLPYGDENFALDHGRLDYGAAYWCDRGLLCSAACSLAHHKKRMAEGTLPTEPAPDPYEAGLLPTIPPRR